MSAIQRFRSAVASDPFGVLLGKTSVFYGRRSDPLPLGIIIEADSRQLAVEKGRPLTAGLDGRVALCPP